MVINENNTHINSFTKGMNSDTAYDQLPNAQYTFAKNIRITKNQSLGGASDYSALREGIVTPVLNQFISNEYMLVTSPIPEIKMLNTVSVDDINIIIYSSNNDLVVYKIDIYNPRNFSIIWIGNDFFKNTDKKQVSTVLYKELDNVVKLYIATGIKPIIEIRVDDNRPSYIDRSNGKFISVDYLINNRIVPQDRVYIKDVISGRLPASQVQYTYRFYNKYGNTTQLAPLTNKIQIIDSSRDKETGNAEGTETSKGLQLSIPTAKYIELFERMQVFRLTYTKPNENSEIALIYDDKIKADPLIINDVGIDPLQTLTIEEFSAMSGLILVPKYIENNQNYMFCANVQDDTIIKDLTIDNVDNNNTYLDAVYTNVNLAENCDGGIPKISKSRFPEYIHIKTYDNDNFVESISDYFEEHCINPLLPLDTYNDMFTSSLLRSLRRGETYKYGIVYYDKYGRRSDVKGLGAIEIDEINLEKARSIPFGILNPGTDNILEACPIGVRIRLPQPIIKDENGNETLANDIIGCQIVRRSSSEIYQNTLLQVALARPIQQKLALTNGDFDSGKMSPFYPTGFLTTNNIIVTPPYYEDLTQIEQGIVELRDQQYKDYQASTKNKKLFQVFSSEIDYRRNDVVEKLNVSNTQIQELLYLYPGFSPKMYGEIASRVVIDPSSHSPQSETVNPPEDYLKFFGIRSIQENGELYTVIHKDIGWPLTSSEKEEVHFVLDYFNAATYQLSNQANVNSIKDVKIPNWNDGFSNLQWNDSDLMDGIKKYKSFTTTINDYIYNNWISACKYDFKITHNQSVANQEGSGDTYGEFMDKKEKFDQWIHLATLFDDVEDKARCGYIGPGPSCLLMTTSEDFGTYSSVDYLFTSICNIKHNPKTEDVQSDEQTVYYGFGNYFKLKLNKTNTGYVVDNGTDNGSNSMVVFDGDIYITLHEFTTLYKAYDFDSIDTLQSTQITNYIPLESKVNTCFDYGKNLLNTNSANLIYEPGQVEGIVTQERPAHQYNMIYSDNDASNDVFTLISTDKDETNIFRQRAYFSEPKINGEFIDNYQIFKPASFIDVDSKYGPITYMMTDKNQLYYWQENAFGKFSVNERSLINDTNGNTIMLGQAGILSRYDYISNKFGMRDGDMCACSAAQKIFWIDINNKAVVAGNNEQAINYGEQLNVQNIINDKISEDIPRIDFDLQNDELLCKINKDEQIIFNTKYNIATSVYTRKYDDIINVKNHLFGLYMGDKSFLLNKYNYLDESVSEYLSPMELKFVVNPNASITKAFDNQQIVPIKRSVYKSSSVNNINAEFKTDLYDAVKAFNKDMWTDREGNILYTIPRYGNKQFGNRLRGKWMEVSFDIKDPVELTTISHVITKFRQSFS